MTTQNKAEPHRAGKRPLVNDYALEVSSEEEIEEWVENGRQRSSKMRDVDWSPAGKAQIPPHFPL